MYDHPTLSRVLSQFHFTTTWHSFLKTYWQPPSTSFASLLQFYSKTWVGFWLNTKPRFTIEISNNDQWKERHLFCKLIQGFFKKTLRWKDRQLFICGLLEFKRFFYVYHRQQLSKKQQSYLQNWGSFFSSLHHE